MITTNANTSYFDNSVLYNYASILLPPTAGIEEKFDLPSIFPPYENFPISQTANILDTNSVQITKDESIIIKVGKKYFDENKATLLEKYKNQYIAIINNEVVDSDENFSKLAVRVYEKYGYQTIYMPYVEAENKVLMVPSPITNIS
jgi:hypothetical protein